MRKTVVFAALAGLAVSMAGLGKLPLLAYGTTLEGFSINTDDKAVTVTLVTDQRAQYTTESQGRQFAIILPDAKLSQEQLNNGLPVVIDNKNRFIGRAVPTEDGKVKIILPNLPANEYSVSIQQKRPGQTLVAGPANITKPRAAVTVKADNTFEAVAESFPKPVVERPPSKTAASKPDLSPPAPVRLSSEPGPALNTGGNHSGTIWNPYVVKAPSVPRIARSSYSRYKPVHRLNRPTASQAPELNSAAEEPVNIVSIADSNQATGNEPAAGNANPPKDPLWFLHSLPPASPSDMPADNLQGLAQAIPDAPLQLSPAPESAQAQTSPSLLQELKAAFGSIPRWLVITAAVFLGGIGIFALIGALVLLRILFSPLKNQTPAIVLPAGYQLTPLEPLKETVESVRQKSAYASAPKPAFQDTTAINALDYLKSSPASIPQAVQNATLLKFPSRSRQRNGMRRTGTEAAIGLKS